METAPDHTDATDRTGHTDTLTLLGTTDIHGDLLGWDYYADEPARPAAGLVRAATIIRHERDRRPDGSVLLVDVGDTIQGNPLASSFIDDATRPHPIASAMNALGYAATTVGNHEFNFGIETLRRFERDLDCPLLAANVFDGDAHAFPPWTIAEARIGGRAVRVGLVGVTTPGSAVWDRDKLTSLRFEDVVESARSSVNEVRAAGAEIVVVLSHSGLGPSSSYGDAIPLLENATRLIAQEVEDIDAVFLGHAHVSVCETITNSRSGAAVPVVEPSFGCHELGRIELHLDLSGDRVSVRGTRAELLSTTSREPDPELADLCRPAHEATRTRVSAPVGVLAATLDGSAATLGPSSLLDFVNHVQASHVRHAVAGTAYDGLPVLSVAAPHGVVSGVPGGEVTVRDLAGVYPFESTLFARVLTGAQLRDYLEHAAAYYRRSDGRTRPEALRRAPSEATPTGTPDFQYDVLGTDRGVVSYSIDARAPVLQRIADLLVDGDPVADDDRVLVAVNDYRGAGGGGYPHIGTAETAYDGQVAVRELLIQYVREHSPLQPASLGHSQWRLIT